MKSLFEVRLLILLLAIGGFFLTGCSAFSGAATMRIDVEVYKGPLSERPNVQLGMMKGHLESAKKALIESNNFTRAVMANKGFEPWSWSSNKAWSIPKIETDVSGDISPSIPLISPLDQEGLGTTCQDVSPDNPWYNLKFWRLFGLLDDIDHFDCLILTTLISDTNMLTQKVDNLTSKISNPIPWSPQFMPAGFIEEAAEISGMLRDQAFRWAVASTPGQSPNRLVRIAVVTGIVTFSEIGNQLRCRVNALAKQTNDDIGLDRRELPPSVALCDADPTDFVNLYNYFNGTVPDWLGKYALGMGTVEDRVKIVKDLFSDHYWSRINTVYASGRGKVSMAFIKDDVGNWNLKSFDNDPEELLKAYTDFSVEAAKRAAMAIQSASPGGPVAPTLSLATRLMEQATTNAFGQEATGIEATIIPRLHRTTEARLQNAAREYQEKDTKLLNDYNQILKKVNASRESRSDTTEMQPMLKEAKKALIENRQGMLAKFEAIVREHKKTISGYVDVD